MRAARRLLRSSARWMRDLRYRGSSRARLGGAARHRARPAAAARAARPARAADEPAALVSTPASPRASIYAATMLQPVGGMDAIPRAMAAALRRRA